MQIWIDLANSPHVPFFHALIPEFTARGHTCAVTARNFAQTVELAAAARMMAHVVGWHGGGSITGKAGNLLGRAAARTHGVTAQDAVDHAAAHTDSERIERRSRLREHTLSLVIRHQGRGRRAEQLPACHY